MVELRDRRSGGAVRELALTSVVVRLHRLTAVYCAALDLHRQRSRRHWRALTMALDAAGREA